MGIPGFQLIEMVIDGIDNTVPVSSPFASRQNLFAMPHCSSYSPGIYLDWAL